MFTPSFRASAWLAGTILGALLILALLIQHAQELNAILLYLEYGAAFCCALALLYGLLLAWHHVRMRQLERARIAQEVSLRREQVALSRHTSALLTEARTNGDNVKLTFTNEGKPKTIEVIRASTLAQYAPRIEQITERQPLQIGERKGVLPARFPPPVDFLEVLDSFEPSPSGIYLAKTVEGSIVEQEQDLTHIALTGPSGGGKTNTTRLITSQLLSTGAHVYLASPNFAPVKLNGHRLEDWRPIMRYLKSPPAQSAQAIEKLIQSFLRLFEQRKEAEQHSPRRGRDVFLILGEWPGIAARVKDAAHHIGLLLRESRQYGIHILTEMQDALVKTTQIDSGMIENLRTGGYFGGDKITAKRVLDLKSGQELSEDGLGKQGALWLRSYTHGLNAGRVPFLSNQALYALLGAPPDPVPDTEIYDNSQIAERYAPYTLVDTSTRRTRQTSRRFYSLPTMPDLPTRQTDPVAPAYRPMRPGVERAQHAFVARTETPSGSLAREEGPFVCAQENGVRRPLEQAHTAHTSAKRLNEQQSILFCALYEQTGNIDESLKGAGANTSYRAHARELVAALK